MFKSYIYDQRSHAFTYSTTLLLADIWLSKEINHLSYVFGSGPKSEGEWFNIWDKNLKTITTTHFCFQIGLNVEYNPLGITNGSLMIYTVLNFDLAAIDISYKKGSKCSMKINNFKRVANWNLGHSSVKTSLP